MGPGVRGSHNATATAMTATVTAMSRLAVISSARLARGEEQHVVAGAIQELHVPPPRAELGDKPVQETETDEIAVHEKAGVLRHERFERDDVHVEPRLNQIEHPALDAVVA